MYSVNNYKFMNYDYKDKKFFGLLLKDYSKK